MLKEAGDVQLFHLFDCSDGFAHQINLEECKRHTEQETENAFGLLRSDLDRGDHVIVRFRPDLAEGDKETERCLHLFPKGKAMMWMGKCPDDADTFVLDEEKAVLHVRRHSYQDRFVEELKIPLAFVWSVEVDDRDIDDGDSHPIVSWRHEDEFCFDGQIWYRTEFKR